MFGISEEYFIPIAQAVGIAIFGALYVIGQKYGSSRSTTGEKTLEVAGALVDNRAVELLAGSIEGATRESIEARYGTKKLTEGVGSLVRALEGVARSNDRMTDELKEIRTEIRELGDTLRHRR